MSDSSVIETIIGSCRRVAVVGLSDKPDRPSNGVASLLLDAGFEVVPVNPNVTEVFGIPAAPSLAEVEGPVDVVDVFRRPEHAPQIVRDAIAVGARAVWLQLGLHSEEARRLANDAGLLYVEDECLGVHVGRARHRHEGVG